MLHMKNENISRRDFFAKAGKVVAAAVLTGGVGEILTACVPQEVIIDRFFPSEEAWSFGPLTIVRGTDTEMPSTEMTALGPDKHLAIEINPDSVSREKLAALGTNEGQPGGITVRVELAISADHFPMYNVQVTNGSTIMEKQVISGGKAMIIDFGNGTVIDFGIRRRLDQNENPKLNDKEGFVLYYKQLFGVGKLTDLKKLPQPQGFNNEWYR